MPPWCNYWLLGAMALSLSLHFVILEVDFLSVSPAPVTRTCHQHLLDLSITD